MSSKYSERHIRQAKIDEFRKQLLEQIHWELEGKFEILSDIYCRVKDLDKMRVYISDIADLYILENTIKRENFLMEVYKIDESIDYIVYAVTDEALDFIVQHDDILYKILSTMEVSCLILDNELDDSYFESEVYTIVDRIIWEEMREKEN